MSRNDSYRSSGRGRNWNGNRDRDRNERNNRRNDRRDRQERSDRNKNYDSRSSEHRFEQSRQFANSITQKEIQENENAIRAFKENVLVCELCGQPINDLANAISNKKSGNPVHFDCVLSRLAETEKPGANDRVAYIGQGRFAVIHYDNPHDQKHFAIRKIIEWEERDKQRGAWRDEMAGLYSQVK